jgi:hypothetical protein
MSHATLTKPYFALNPPEKCRIRGRRKLKSGGGVVLKNMLDKDAAAITRELPR